jgi:hypothetical protein
MGNRPIADEGLGEGLIPHPFQQFGIQRIMFGLEFSIAAAKKRRICEFSETLSEMRFEYLYLFRMLISHLPQPGFIALIIDIAHMLLVAHKCMNGGTGTDISDAVNPAAPESGRTSQPGIKAPRSLRASLY